MIVFIDDERWTIQAYFDELEQKSEKRAMYTPIHFYFPVDALEFIENNFQSIDAIVLDIGMDYGNREDLMNNSPGGIQFYKRIKSIPILIKIPIIILTVFDKHQIELDKGIDLTNDNKITYIDRNQPDRDDAIWRSINSAIDRGYFN